MLARLELLHVSQDSIETTSAPKTYHSSKEEVTIQFRCPATSLTPVATQEGLEE